MPEQYTRIRDALIKQGQSAAKAKQVAAATYNKQNPGAPVTRSYDKKHPSRLKKHLMRK